MRACSCYCTSLHLHCVGLENAPAAEELDNFSHILEMEGVIVRRPEVRPGDFDRPVSTPDFESKTQLYAAMPRDVLIVVSDHEVQMVVLAAVAGIAYKDGLHAFSTDIEMAKRVSRAIRRNLSVHEEILAPSFRALFAALAKPSTCT